MMRDIMPWTRCKNEFIRTVEKDPSKIRSLLATSEERLAFIKAQSVTEKNSSFIIEGYYEVIKELLTALLLQQGLRSSNHQCLISYFSQTYPEYEKETNLLSRLCYLRNRLEYYGEFIPFNFYETNITSIIKLITILKTLTKDKNR